MRRPTTMAPVPFNRSSRGPLSRGPVSCRDGSRQGQGQQQWRKSPFHCCSERPFGSGPVSCRDGSGQGES